MLYCAVGFLLFVINAGAPGYALRQIRIESAVMLIQEMKSDTQITLKAGTYNLSDAADAIAPAVKWNGVFDGKEPHLTGLKNLTLRGEGEVKILITPRYAWVMCFRDCESLAFENLIIGHTDAGYCTGGVLRFLNSKKIGILKCTLFGSGTEGISLENVSDFRFVESSIRDCTYDLISIRGSRRIAFRDSALRNTGEFNLINIDSSSDILFDRCIIENNWNGAFMPYLFNIGSDCGTVSLRASTIRGNRVQKFANRPDLIKLGENRFESNGFTDFSDEELNRKGRQ